MYPGVSLVLGVLEHMLCCSTGGTGRGSPAAALDPRWEAALPLHAWHQDEERQRCISNAAVPEQGLGHPVPSPGPAWSRFVLGLASPLPVAKAVLVVFLFGEELRGVQQNLTFSFSCCQNPRELHCQGAWPGVAAMGLSQSTQLETVIPSSC